MTKIFGIIYKITNKINGKCYIGQTIKSLKNRWAEHCGSGSQCRLLRDDIKIYGKENFTIEEIIKCFSMEEMNKLEPFYIKEQDTLSPNGYNLMTGGRNSLPSEETKKKRAQTRANKPDEEKAEIKRKNQETWANKSEEEKLNYSKSQSESSKIAQNRPEVKEKKSINGMVAQNKPDIRANKSKLLKGKNTGPKSEKHKKKLSNSSKIAQNRPEVAFKKSKSMKENWANKSEKEKAETRNRQSKSGKIAANRPEVIESKKYHAHIRWDVNRNIINPNCKFCTVESNK